MKLRSFVCAWDASTIRQSIRHRRSALSSTSRTQSRRRARRWHAIWEEPAGRSAAQLGVLVRINPLGSTLTLGDSLPSSVPASDGILIPKVSGIGDIELIRIRRCAGSRHGVTPGHVKLLWSRPRRRRHGRFAAMQHHIAVSSP